MTAFFALLFFFLRVKKCDYHQSKLYCEYIICFFAIGIGSAIIENNPIQIAIVISIIVTLMDSKLIDKMLLESRIFME